MSEDWLDWQSLVVKIRYKIRKINFVNEGEKVCSDFHSQSSIVHNIKILSVVKVVCIVLKIINGKMIEGNKLVLKLQPASSY